MKEWDEEERKETQEVRRKRALYQASRRGSPFLGPCQYGTTLLLESRFLGYLGAKEVED